MDDHRSGLHACAKIFCGRMMRGLFALEGMKPVRQTGSCQKGISVHIIKSNAARIDRQDDRKGLIAVDIDRLFGVAIINLKLLHLLLIHGNQCALISTLCGELCNSFLNLREFSARAEEISEGKSRAIDIDGKSVVAHVLRIRNICSHCVRNTSIDRPILLDLLRRTNVSL